MKLYPLKRTSKGRKQGEFPLGSVDWEDGLKLDVRDRQLRESLREYFQQPVWVPLPMGDEDELMGHTWECLDPGDEEHFFEAVRRLHRRDLVVDLDS